jgi:hypothetical protein
MIVVRVELHSAVTGKIKEIARAVIYNDGTGTGRRGNYKAFAVKGRQEPMTPKEMWQGTKLRESEVKDYRRIDLHVWNLVVRALSGMGYK